MDKITCEICRDLIPLVKDGVASEDSRKAVAEHLKECTECMEFYGNEKIPEPDSTKIFHKISNRVNAFLIFILFICVFIGTGFTGGEYLFYNCIIMPVTGALGYIVYSRKAFINIPVTIFAVQFVVNFSILDSALWAFIYSIFAIVGIIIAALMHFALKKEDVYEK